MNIRTFAISVLFGVSALLTAFAQPALNQQEKQNDKGKKEPLPALKLGVVIEDEVGNQISNLKAEDLELYENVTKQVIETLTYDPTPLSLGIVIDTSGSMKNYLNAVRAIAAKIISLKKPDDEIFLAQFKAEPELLYEFTRVPRNCKRR